MGTVHGVYLKYVGLSALSYYGYSLFTKNVDGERLSVWDLVGLGSKTLVLAVAPSSATQLSVWRAVPALIMGYSTILNGVIAILFKIEWGMGLIGKNRRTGQIPTWSYLFLFPFHLPTILYTHVHTLYSTHKVKKEGKMVRQVVPVASEIQPGWWVGGCYAHRLHNKTWAAIIDLTVEFPERSIGHTRAYLSIPTWDGVPCSPAQLEEAANFAVAASQQGGDVLVHCAHGRGRSTTVMCACLVKAGLFATWQEAFERGIRPQRSVCKLNRRMRENLTKWQTEYVDTKKES